MKLFLRGIVFLIAITFFVPFASGQTIYWVGDTQFGTIGTSSPATGDYNTAANWSTNPPSVFTTQTGTFEVPVFPDIAVFYPGVNETGTFDITQNGSGNTLGGLLVNSNSPIGFFILGGTVNLTNNAPLTVTGSASVGGRGDNVVGDMDVDGDTTLTLQGTGAFSVTNGRIVIGDNFNTSIFDSPAFTGTLNINSGTFSTDPTTGHQTETNIGSGAGATGTVTQGTDASGSTPATFSIMTTGNWFYIGVGGGTGNYSLTNGSTLNTGATATPIIALGVNTSVTAGGAAGTGATALTSNGTLTITGASTVNIGNVIGTTADLQLGALAVGATAGTGGIGTITQNGVGSNVNILGSSTMEIGDAAGSTGIYNLELGNLNIGATSTDTATVALGVGAGSVGTLTQSTGTTLNALADTSFTVGNVAGTGMGVYTINGGTANFSTALTLEANGTLFLNGGTLNIAAENLAAVGPGVGFLNFGGGTLKFISSAATTYTDNFGGGVLSGGTSTIDVSASSLTSFTFASFLSGAGGITLIGNGATVFNFASATGGAGAANTYSGSTGILGGTLNALGADFAFASASSTLTIGAAGSPATLNLALGATSLTLPEAISGNGTLKVNFNAGGETLTLNNISNSLSTVNITLAANTGPDHSLTPGTLQVYSGSFGTISEVGAGNNVVIGDNTGTTTGTVTFTSATYTGTTTVNSGFILNVPSLTSAVTNAGTLNVTGAAGIVGAVTNSGTLNVTGAPGGITGTVSNSGLVNVTGSTGIVGNVTSNIGTLNTTSVTGNVTTSGVFTASSNVNTVTGNLVNTGTVMSTSALPAVINTPTFTVGGTLTLNPGGTLVVRTNGTVADDYHVGGTATLNNGVIQVQVVGGGKIGTTTYTIVTGSAVTDAGVALNANTALFTFVLTNTGTAEDLMVTQTSIGAFAQTPNERAVAGAIDGTTSPLFAFFSQIPVGAGAITIPQALEELSPESLQYSRIISFENSNMLAIRMNGVDADLRGGYGGLDTSAVSVVAPGFDSNLGRSLGSLLAYNDPAFHQSAPNGVNYYPGGQSGPSSPSSESSSSAPSTPTWDSSSQVISDSPNPYLANQHPSGPEAPNFSEFIGGDVVLADLNQNQSTANSPSSKASYKAGDVTAGVAFRMSSHLAAGVLFDYNHTDAKTDSSGSKTDVDSYSPGLFATYFDHGFYANGLFSFGYNNYSNTRNISFLDETATSKPSGQQYVGDIDLGYDFHPDKHWVVGPTLGATYTHLDIDSFTETGAPGADLAVQSQSADSLRSRLGGHVMFQTYTGDVLLQPSLFAMWQHEYMDDSSGITSSFNDFSSSSFTIDTAAPSRDSALIGCGLTATLNNSMALYLNYLADVGAGDYWAQSVVGGLKARF